MRAIAFPLLGLAAGCASLGQPEPPGPAEILASAQTALNRQDYRDAYDQLSWLYRTQWSTPEGEQALLTMVAVELDPQNPGRRLDAGAVLAGQHLHLPSASAWTTPISRTLYGLAMELNAAQREIAVLQQDVEAAQRDRDAAWSEASREAAAARRARADAADARAEARRVESATKQSADEAPSTPSNGRSIQRERDELAAELERVRARLERRDEELARIRETLASPN